MVNDVSLEYLICPEGHGVSYARWNYAKDFSGEGVDAITLQPTYESGLYCTGCEKAYGLSRLREPETK